VHIRRLISRADTECSTVSSVVCDSWLMLGLETLSISRSCVTDNRWRPAVCSGRPLMALFTRAAKFDPGATARGLQEAKAVHHAIGISRQSNSVSMSSRVNISWHKVSPLSSPFPSLALIHTSLKWR